MREEREFLADRLHAIALLFGKRGARELEVADFAADDALTDGRKRLEGVALFDPEILFIERLVLGDPQIEIRREGQRLIEGVAERRRIDDALEVPDRAPGAGKGERSFFKRHDDRVPGRGRFGGGRAGKRLFKIRGKLFHRRHHVFRAHGGVIDEVSNVEKRVLRFLRCSRHSEEAVGVGIERAAP